MDDAAIWLITEYVGIEAKVSGAFAKGIEGISNLPFFKKYLEPAIEALNSAKNKADEIFRSAREKIALQFVKVQTLKFIPTSGKLITSTPGKTTTILGKYTGDIEHIIKELDLPKSTNMGGNVNGFNILNMPDNFWQNTEQFWRDYNKPWLQAAIDRGDEIIMATKPIDDAIKSGCFAYEYNFLVEKGYKWVESLGKMVK